MTCLRHHRGVRRHGLFAVAAVWLLSCSNDMGDQPSFQAQEAPRKHAPEESWPRDSRRFPLEPPARTQSLIQLGRRVFSINCAHCHGPEGQGDGPVAPHLTAPPTNLTLSAHETPEAVLYHIVSEGFRTMPSFHGLLTPEERWAVVYFLRSFPADPARAQG